MLAVFPPQPITEQIKEQKSFSITAAFQNSVVEDVIGPGLWILGESQDFCNESRMLTLLHHQYFRRRWWWSTLDGVVKEISAVPTSCQEERTTAMIIREDIAPALHSGRGYKDVSKQAEIHHFTARLIVENLQYSWQSSQ